MLSVGNIRLGTLYEYRTMENEQVRDEQEGKFRGHTNPGSMSLKPGALLPGAMSMFSNSDKPIVPPNMSITIDEGAIFSTDIELPDRNIYCMTKVAKESVMRSFDCDACVEITDVNLFGRALAKALNRLQLTNPAGLKGDFCTYNGRNADYYTEKGYWLKAPFYASQEEFRIVIMPFNNSMPVRAEIINIQEIMPFIKLHTF